MCDLNQEPEMPINNNNNQEDEDSIDFSSLRLNSFKYTNHRPPCTICGCTGLTNPTTTTATNPMKRPSPENPTKNSSPKHKKLFHELPQQQQQQQQQESGFTKVTLPLLTTQTQTQTQTQTHSFPVLRRCISDPYTPPLMDSMNPPPQSPPENAKMIMGGNHVVTTPSSSSAAKGSSSSALPPLPPLPLRRSTSDPIPLSPAKTLSRSSSSNDCEESPNFKRLKRMKDCMREISHWWGEAMREDDDEEGVSTENTNNATKDDIETEFEEAVTVERAGEGLIVHFKCPCGKGYHILLSGRSCYYKLM